MLAPTACASDAPEVSVTWNISPLSQSLISTAIPEVMVATLFTDTLSLAAVMVVFTNVPLPVALRKVMLSALFRPSSLVPVIWPASTFIQASLVVEIWSVSGASL